MIFVFCVMPQQWLKANTINLKSEHAVQRLRGGFQCVCFWEKNRTVLGSVIIMHLSCRLFLQGSPLLTTRHLKTTIMVWGECPKALDLPQLLLGTTVVMEGEPCCAGQEDPQGCLLLPWVWDVLTSCCNICLVTFRERVDLMCNSTWDNPFKSP